MAINKVVDWAHQFDLGSKVLNKAFPNLIKGHAPVPPGMPDAENIAAEGQRAAVNALRQQQQAQGFQSTILTSPGQSSPQPTQLKTLLGS